MNKNLFSALRLEKRVMFIILSLIVLVAAFNIISALIMIVMEKNKDIAILKTMGATRAGIMKIFIFQGLIVGAIGTFLGCLAGLAVAFNLEALSRFVEKLFGFKILPGRRLLLERAPLAGQLRRCGDHHRRHAADQFSLDDLSLLAGFPPRSGGGVAL